MLLHLKIKNIAVIEETDIDFYEGLNVLTGETGAGKSIIIDAISMLTGMRSNKELIRTGEEKAVVYGVFMPNEKVWKILESEGINPSEDGLLSVTRELNITGKSVCKIAGNICPLATLKKIGAYLINIHGQQDAMELYSPENHIFLLDKWCADDVLPLLSSYRESYKRYISVAKKNKEISEKQEKRIAEMEYLEHEINEISGAGITLGEEEALIVKRNKIKMAEKFSSSLELAREMLFDSAGSAREKADIAKNKLETLAGEYEELKKPVQILDEIVSLIDDVRIELRSLGDDSFSVLDIEEIVDRLDIINKLKRRYGGSEESILNHLEESSKRYEELKSDEELKGTLEIEQEKLKAEAVEKAEVLSGVRKKYAGILSEEIKKQLADLNMPGCEFITQVDKVSYGGLGCDKVEFLISPNKGEDVKPLSKIASGGELSRIMLAIKCIMAKSDEATTYIFDEIDTGVSGLTAQKVALKLNLVGKSKQTLVITHSAHIAAAADHHFLLYKNVENGRTKTHISHLDFDGRVNEIARINSGSNITETAKNQAKELLEKYM